MGGSHPRSRNGPSVIRFAHGPLWSTAARRAYRLSDFVEYFRAGGRRRGRRRAIVREIHHDPRASATGFRVSRRAGRNCPLRTPR